jgi:surfactin synthase thioesterase subunit
LFGYSMGALAVFELAQRLAAAGGLAPAHLFVAAQAAPHVPRSVPNLHDLADDLFLERVQQRYGPMAPEILQVPELVQLLLPMLRANLEVVECYRYKQRPRLHCGITALAGEQDVSLTREGVEAWREHTDATFTVRWLPAQHFICESHAAEIAREIARALPA